MNYIIEDTIKRSIFGIWSADDGLVEMHKELLTLKL